METTVSTVMTQLREDHRNMATLLDILERETNTAYQGGLPDLELVADVMLYVTVYPDAVHHPLEDRVYAELKAVRPDLAAGMARVTDDHRHLAELGARLREAVEYAKAGQPVQRQEVVRDALRYVDALRKHMRWEERDLFKRIDTMVRDGHDTLDEAKLIAIKDPVFGDEVEERFSSLLDRIKHS